MSLSSPYEKIGKKSNFAIFLEIWSNPIIAVLDFFLPKKAISIVLLWNMK